MKKKAIFMDRDGTLIEEVNFLERVEDLRLFSYTVDSLRILKENGYSIFVVTNQSGIARGIYDEDAMHSIHEAIEERCGNLIDGFYFCPHMPDAGCECRKPRLGMLEKVQKDFEIDMENSWMIGDKLLDIETGFAAGIKTALVRTGYGAKDENELNRRPDIIAENLLEAVRGIVKPEI